MDGRSQLSKQSFSQCLIDKISENFDVSFTELWDKVLSPRDDNLRIWGRDGKHRQTKESGIGILRHICEIMGRTFKKNNTSLSNNA